MPRREFVKASAGLAAMATVAPLMTEFPSRAETLGKQPRRIGIQVGAVSFVDEGTEKVLDILQQRGAVNAGGIVWRQPVEELIRIGPLEVRVKTPPGMGLNRARSLVSGGALKAKSSHGWIALEVRSILDHEVVVMS